MTKKQDPPSIVVQASTPTTSTPELKGKETGPLATLDQVIAPQSARPSRADRGVSGPPPLATVEEGSNPSTPSTERGEEERCDPTHDTTKKRQQLTYLLSLTRQTTAERVPAAQNGASHSNSNTDLSGSDQLTKPTESGSDSAGKKNKSKDGKKSNDPDRTPRPKSVQPKSSYQSLVSLKPKSAAEPSSKKMTVETETVSSAAPTAIGGGDRAISSKAEGSLRLKPSNETIRPKKDRKKARKAPSINSGTGGLPDLSSCKFQHHLHHMASRPILRPRSQTSPVMTENAAFDLQSYWASRLPSPLDSSSYVFSDFIANKTNHDVRKASSKADIFEAKVASAVDDVNSSDSDETFVYESNPPESQPRRSRNHSRTPSTNSMQSMADPRTGLRGLTGVLNAERGVSGKKSMKFANNPYSSSGADDDSIVAGHEGTRGGTVRPSAGSGVHHHHMSRHNRGGLGPLHTTEDDGSSPFTLAGKRAGGNGSRTPSQPASPRYANNNNRAYNGNGTSRKNEFFGAYDLDADGADDERAPLMGTVRTQRSSRTSRVPGNIRLRQLERNEHPRSYWIKRFAGCFVLTVMIAAVVLGAVGFFFVTTKPLYDVEVRAIKNVLASEQEIMLDLHVEAINPNLMTISITDMDVNVFAKSKYVGSEKWWRDHGKPPPPPFGKTDLQQRQHSHSDVETEGKSWFDYPDWGDDDNDYHPPGPEGDQQMMLLGRILHFDNALTFEGSPIKRHLHYSVGEFRVPHPANKTEAGGTERWERVLQHSFQLIVRGILKYNLPLSTHTIAAPIDAAVMVHPEKGPDKKGNLVIGKTKHTGWHYDPEDPDPFFTHIGNEDKQEQEDEHKETESEKIPERGTFRSSAKFRFMI